MIKSATKRIIESTIGGGAVDFENGIIRGVKILGRESKNNRIYTEQAIKEAAALYEGCTVNFDHPSRDEAGKERSFFEAFGELRNIVVKADGVYGDLHFNRSHPAAKQVCEAAERFPNQFGLSHNAEGLGDLKGGRMVIESIVRVNSVDIVTQPATNAGLFESVQGDQPKGKTMKISLKKLVESKGSAVQKKRLLEMDGMLPDQMMTAEMEMPEPGEEASTDDQVAAAFKAMIMSVLDDSSLDVVGKAKKIKEILTAQDKLVNGTAPAAEPTPESNDYEKKPTMESLQRELASLKAERGAIDLLEQVGLPAKRAYVVALAAVSDKDVKKDLLESWKQPAAIAPAAPAKPSFSRPLYESTEVADIKPGEVSKFLTSTY